VTPIAPSDQSSLEDELKHVNPTFPKAAAGFALLAGALGILTAIQVLTSVRIFSAFWAVFPYLLLVLGGALGFFARSVFTARRWAAQGAVVVGALQALVSGAWLVFAVSNGFIALYAIWTPVWSVVAVGLCAAALAPCSRAQRARERLRAQGMDIGL
jgi:hypothetical protein